MGITPSCFCPNLLPHSFDTDRKTLHYAYMKSQKWPAYSSCPSAKHTPISIYSTISRKKNPNHRNPEHIMKKTIKLLWEEYWVYHLGGHSGGRCLSREPISSFYGCPMWSFPFSFPFWSPFLQNKISVTFRSNTISYRSANKFCMWELASTLFMQYQDLQDLSAQLLSSQSLFSPWDIWVL